MSAATGSLNAGQNSTPAEVSGDDLAFIAQFADFEETPAPSPFSGGASHNVRNIAPIPKRIAKKDESSSSDSEPDSEDEIEQFLTSPQRVKDEGSSGPDKLPIKPLATKAEANSDSDSDSDSSTNAGLSKISDKQHAKLTHELDALTSTAGDTVYIPAPISDSESSDADDEDDPSPSTKATQSKNKKRSTAAHDDAGDGLDGEDDAPTSAAFFASKHEVANPPIPTVDIIEVGPHERIEPVGHVKSVIGDVIIVQVAFDSGHGVHRVLETGSLLVFEDRKVLGPVFEALGPIVAPLYCVRLPPASKPANPALSDPSDSDPSSSAIPEPAPLTASSISVGAKVFCAPNRSVFLSTSALRMMKGSDASNVYDEEVDDRELEFSDDEEERAHKKRLESMRKERAQTPSSRQQQASNPSTSNGFYAPQSHSSSGFPSDEMGDIFYGDAYDDPPATSSTPSTSYAVPAPPTPSNPLKFSNVNMTLDPRATHSMPSAYDEISPYDDPPPTTPLNVMDPENATRLSPALSTASGSTALGRGRGAGGRDRGRGNRKERGRGRDRGGAAHSPMAANTSVGSSGQYPRRSSSASGSVMGGDAHSTATRGGGEQYDPRRPDPLVPSSHSPNSPTSPTSPSQSNPSSPRANTTKRKREQRALSPTSLAIARATGQMPNGAPLPAHLQPNSTSALSHQQGFGDASGSGGGAGFGPMSPMDPMGGMNMGMMPMNGMGMNMPMGMGMDMSMGMGMPWMGMMGGMNGMGMNMNMNMPQQIPGVAPHINPRFAAAMMGFPMMGMMGLGGNGEVPDGSTADNNNSNVNVEQYEENWRDGGEEGGGNATNDARMGDGEDDA